MEEFACANFPVDRGVIGYRVCFISPSIKKLNIGQGIGWLDEKILKYNGFNVRSVSNYESLFLMVSLERVDLFSREINEILSDYNEFKNLKNLEIDQSFLLYYPPLPRFFFTNKKAIMRIQEGLKIAFEDGSLDEAFNNHYNFNLFYSFQFNNYKY